MQKFLCLLLLAWVISINLSAQQLNEFGHIIPLNEPEQPDVKHLHSEDDRDYLEIDGRLYPGNSIYQLRDGGFITLEGSCGNTEVAFRYYDPAGEKLSEQLFPQVINLGFSPNERYAYFQSGNGYRVIDLSTLETTDYPGAVQMAVGNRGQTAYHLAKEDRLAFENHSYSGIGRPLALKFDEHGALYAFYRNNYLLDTAGRSIGELIPYPNEATFFQAQTISGQVYYSLKKQEGKDVAYALYHESAQLNTRTYDRDARKKPSAGYKSGGATIPSPLKPDLPEAFHRIGNSYAEHQFYGGSPYLHPGVDMLSAIEEPVYAVHDGYVKAVLTTGGAIYWRIAIGNEDISTEQEGYLYAHLIESTIPFQVGDYVEAGDYIGSIIEWPSYDFHHLHFARLRHSGTDWMDGDWLTVDNVLADLDNYVDDTGPVFEDLPGTGEPVGFRSPDDPLIGYAPDSLYGLQEIVVHAHDISNDENWRVDVNRLWYELLDVDGSSLLYQDAYTYDFLLDAYIDDVVTIQILETIYAREGLFQTEGNYNTREFYQVISRSNGDGIIDLTDRNEVFDTELYPDGDYILRVCADDAAENTTCIDQPITIQNQPFVSALREVTNKRLNIFPNPSGGTIRLQLPGTTIDRVVISNLIGRPISAHRLNASAELTFGALPAGTYLLSAYAAGGQLLAVERLVIR